MKVANVGTIKLPTLNLTFQMKKIANLFFIFGVKPHKLESNSLLELIKGMDKRVNESS